MPDQFGAEAHVNDSDVRATVLFLSSLTPAQRRQWDTHRYLVVQGHVSGNRYLLQHGKHACRLNNEGKICEFLCCTTVGMNVPKMDRVLIRKLLIENHETYFLTRTGRLPWYSGGEYRYYLPEPIE